MPATAPTLSWELTTGVVPTDVNDIAAILTAIKTAITASTHWSVITDGIAAGTPHLEIGPAGGELTAMRILIASGITNTNTWYSSSNANSLKWGLAPDGGTLGTVDSATPYGVGVRWCGYGCLSPNYDLTAGGSGIGIVYVLNSAEVILIKMKDETTEDWSISHAGVPLIAPSDSSSLEAKGRIYALFAADDAWQAATFWGSATGYWTGHESAQGGGVGCFNPSAPTSVVFLTRSAFTCEVQPKGYTFASEWEINTVPYFLQASPYYRVGQTRQSGISHDTLSLSTVAVGGVDKIWAIGGNSIATEDAMLFYDV